MMVINIKARLKQQLRKVEYLTNTSKIGRFLHHPLKYIYAIILKNFIYPINNKEQTKSCSLFTKQKIHILLPAATDIYLTGGKTHSSEIRLAKFLIQNLDKNDHFWDIGAHYGYFSLIASKIIRGGVK